MVCDNAPDVAVTVTVYCLGGLDEEPHPISPTSAVPATSKSNRVNLRPCPPAARRTAPLKGNSNIPSINGDNPSASKSRWKREAVF